MKNKKILALDKEEVTRLMLRFASDQASRSTLERILRFSEINHRNLPWLLRKKWGNESGKILMNLLVEGFLLHYLVTRDLRLVNVLVKITSFKGRIGASLRKDFGFRIKEILAGLNR